MTTLKDMFARGLAVVAIVIAIIGIFTPVGHMTAGQILDTFTGDYFNAVTANGGGAFQINGVNVITAATGKNLIDTTCNLIGSNASQAASSTVAYDCVVPGLTAASHVIAQLASTTPRTAGSASWFISAVGASTTAGFATVLLTNYGPAAIPSVSGVGSSTVIEAFN